LPLQCLGMHPTRPTHAIVIALAALAIAACGADRPGLADDAIANDVLAAARMAIQDVDSFAFAFESYQEPVLDIGAPADYVDPATSPT